MTKTPRKKEYACLIFDADHTLLNYFADEHAAFERVYRTLGMKFTGELAAFSRRASEETWTEAGMYDVHDPIVQKRYHEVYRSHVEGIFEKVFARFPRQNLEIGAKAAGELFLKHLEAEGWTLPFVKETLAALSDKTGGRYAVCIATNGLSAIQRGRLAPLMQYVSGVYISEEVGAIKPLPAFFERIFEEQGVKPKDCLMIGDSLSSDVAGARAAGVDSCWFNPRGEENGTGIFPDYEIRNLEQLSSIL